MAWLEPCSRRDVEGEEAMVSPVAGGEKEDREEDGAVDAGAVQGVG